jgi:hypothetical protein
MRTGDDPDSRRFAVPAAVAQGRCAGVLLELGACPLFMHGNRVVVSQSGVTLVVDNEMEPAWIGHPTEHRDQPMTSTTMSSLAPVDPNIHLSSGLRLTMPTSRGKKPANLMVAVLQGRARGHLDAWTLDLRPEDPGAE